MAGPLQIELVAADRTVWSGQANEIIARTVDGDMGVLPDHAPLLALLSPGVVEIFTTEGEKVHAAVEDGFISVADNRVSILSEDTYLSDEIDRDKAHSELQAAIENGDENAIRRAEAKVFAVEKAQARV